MHKRNVSCRDKQTCINQVNKLDIYAVILSEYSIELFYTNKEKGTPFLILKYLNNLIGCVRIGFFFFLFQIS